MNTYIEDEFIHGASLPVDEEHPDFCADDMVYDVTQIYFNEIGQRALLTVEQERHLSRLVRQGDFDARQKMI